MAYDFDPFPNPTPEQQAAARAHLRPRARRMVIRNAITSALRLLWLAVQALVIIAFLSSGKAALVGMGLAFGAYFIVTLYFRFRYDEYGTPSIGRMVDDIFLLPARLRRFHK